MNIVYAVRPNNKTFSQRCVSELQALLGGLAVPRTTQVADDCDLLIHWGYKSTPALRSAIALRKPFVIVDRGYFDPERVNRVSISFNGHHSLSMPVDGIMDLPPRYHPEIQPWREDGTTVQIIGQVDGDASLRGLIVEPWLNRVAGDAVDAYGLKVIKRLHPKMLNAWERPSAPLQDTFADTYVSVSWTSTAAVQTVLAGVRSVICHPASPAYGMGSSIVGDSLRMPGRILWAHELSHREYDLLDPADSVACAEYIIRGLDKATRQAADGIYDTEGLR